MTEEDILQALTKAAVETDAGDRTKMGIQSVPAFLYMKICKKRLKTELAKRGIESFYEKIQYLTKEGLYGSYILENYSEEEILEAESYMKPERNNLFNYSGLDLLLNRYVIQTHDHIKLETPQEMYMGIALHLAMKEMKDKMKWVKKFYDMLSKQEVPWLHLPLSKCKKAIPSAFQLLY
mgnify:CR=1 FL=1